MGVDVDRGHGGHTPAVSAAADIDHRAPFREPRAALVIFLQPLGELCRARRSRVPPGHAAGSGVPSSTLMPGMAPACSISLTSRRAVFGILQMVSS